MNTPSKAGIVVYVLVAAFYLLQSKYFQFTERYTEFESNVIVILALIFLHVGIMSLYLYSIYETYNNSNKKSTNTDE